MKDTSNVKLQRSLRPVDVWALALGSIIGWGAFVMPGNTFLPKAGPLGSTLSLIASALIMVSISLNYAYMINKYPKAGGEFTYSKESFGPTSGFICAWFLGLSYISIVPLNATALALIGRNLFPSLFQRGFLYAIEGYDIFLGEIFLATFALIAVGFLNIKGVSIIGRFQYLLVFMLVLTVAILGVTALVSPKASFGNLFPLFQTVGKGESISIIGIVSVIAIAPWAFVGFDSVPQAAEEFDFSYKKTRAIMVASILFGALLYIVLNLVSAAVVPAGYENWKEYVENIDELNGIVSMPTFNAANQLLGKTGLFILGVSLFCAVLSGMFGFYMATSRLLYSLAIERVLPSCFAKLHPQYKTPYVSIIFVMLFSLVAPWLGREVIGWIVDMSSIGAAIGYGFTSAATYYALKRENGGVLSKFNALLGTFFSALFICVLLSPQYWGLGGLGMYSRIALGIWSVLGFCFYYYSKKRAKSLG